MRTHKNCAAAYAALFLFGWMLNATALDGVAQAQSDIVFVTGDSSLSRFDMGTESFVTGTGGQSAFLGVTVLRDEILVGDYLADAIQRFSPDGTYLGEFASIATPTYLETDSSGNVYTTPFSTDPSGPDVATRFNSFGVPTQTFSAVNEIAGIDADAAGNVYISENNGMNPDELLKFAPDGTFLDSVLVPGRAFDISIDEVANRLYLASSEAGLGIKVFDISGAIPVLLGGIITPTTANIVGVHYAKESGNILATDFGVPSDDARGLEYSPAGLLLREYRPTVTGIVWDITTFVIPEPASLTLVSLGMLSLVFKRRRRD